MLPPALSSVRAMPVSSPYRTGPPDAGVAGSVHGTDRFHPGCMMMLVAIVSSPLLGDHAIGALLGQPQALQVGRHALAHLDHVGHTVGWGRAHADDAPPSPPPPPPLLFLS